MAVSGQKLRKKTSNWCIIALVFFLAALLFAKLWFLGYSWGLAHPPTLLSFHPWALQPALQFPAGGKFSWGSWAQISKCCCRPNLSQYSFFGSGGGKFPLWPVLFLQEVIHLFAWYGQPGYFYFSAKSYGWARPTSFSDVSTYSSEWTLFLGDVLWLSFNFKIFTSVNKFYLQELLWK